MNKTLKQQTYPVYLLEIERGECRLDSVDAIANHLKQVVEANPATHFIGLFDHFAHTSRLPGGQVANEIRAAVNLVFCFGLTLPEPAQLATRPRSVGICETDRGFVITFLESPMPVVNGVMESWAESLCREPVEAGSIAHGG